MQSGKILSFDKSEDLSPHCEGEQPSLCREGDYQIRTLNEGESVLSYCSYDMSPLIKRDKTILM